MSANSANVTQDQTNQATLATQQTNTQAALIAAEQKNDSQINSDLGTGASVPQPANLPTVAGIMGPGESDILAGLTSSSQATSESEAAAAVDPNETGILAAFAASAAGENGSLKDQTLQMASSYGTQSSTAENLIASSSQASQTALAGDVGTTSNPLGSQLSSVPSYTVNETDGATPAASSSGVSPLVLGGVVAAGALGLYAMRKHIHV